MADSFLQKILPFSKIPADYFPQKRVGIDFIDFARRTAEYTAYELMLKHDIRPLYNFFRTLIDGLLYLNASVFLLFPGEPLVVSAHTHLPDQTHRYNSVQQSKRLFKAGNKLESQNKLVEGFDVTKEYMRELIAQLADFFKDRQFCAVCAPHDAFVYANFMARNGMVDCMLTNSTLYTLCEIDVIYNFRIAHDNSYLGELVSHEQMAMMIQQFGGFTYFMGLTLLVGNEYFPGFWKSYAQAAEALTASNGNIISAACAMNTQYTGRLYKMSDSYLLKGIFEFFCHFYYGVVFHFDTHSFASANAADYKDLAILDRYFEKKVLGLSVQKPEITLAYAAGVDRAQKSIKVEDHQNYINVGKISTPSTPFFTGSVIDTLGIAISNDTAVVDGKTFDLRMISFYGSYLEGKPLEVQKKFRYVRAPEVDVSIEDCGFAVKEDDNNTDDVIIKF